MNKLLFVLRTCLILAGFLSIYYFQMDPVKASPIKPLSSESPTPLPPGPKPPGTHIWQLNEGEFVQFGGKTWMLIDSYDPKLLAMDSWGMSEWRPSVTTSVYEEDDVKFDPEDVGTLAHKLNPQNSDYSLFNFTPTKVEKSWMDRRYFECSYLYVEGDYHSDICSYFKKSSLGLLTYDEYNYLTESGLLNESDWNYDWWLSDFYPFSNYEEESLKYTNVVVKNDGTISTPVETGITSNAVRPTLYIQEDLYVQSGSGLRNNPYVLEESPRLGFGNAINFNNNYEMESLEFMEIPYQSSLTGNSNYTVAFWINPDDFYLGESGVRTIYTHELSDNKKIKLQLGNSSLIFGAKEDYEWVEGQVAYIEDKIDNYAWNHIALVADGSSLKLYINGILEYTMLGLPTISLKPGDSFRLGRDYLYEYDAPDYFDDMMIWSVAKNELEIRSWLTRELTSTEVNASPNLVSYYKFNEKAGDIAHDEKGNYNVEVQNTFDTDWVESSNGGIYYSNGIQPLEGVLLGGNEPGVNVLYAYSEEGTLEYPVTGGAVGAFRYTPVSIYDLPDIIEYDLHKSYYYPKYMQARVLPSDDLLLGLSINGHSITTGANGSYSIYVPASVSSAVYNVITLPGSTFTVTGSTYNNQMILNFGVNSYNILVTSEDGVTKKNYTIKVYRAFDSAEIRSRFNENSTDGKVSLQDFVKELREGIDINGDLIVTKDEITELLTYIDPVSTLPSY